ncbi:glycosyl-transferase for dystroglycan-domain-containing protein [Epithele typhae]|uniref:glycosyl-transferase for dystroglycan-domain-containing protein n=1 Tax=Epithele typhae TaxID=378194 RepID=UPI00200722A1|nr:glycosyl-transferase for dystroglycan-domain-containing protein [Epithele typhae]KAH9927495.1 glycosyl-transferase for dystroglycan-domain-containing protein [Epithele typhae]
MACNIWLKILQSLVLLYVLAAVLFTTWVHVLHPVSNLARSQWLELVSDIRPRDSEIRPHSPAAIDLFRDFYDTGSDALGDGSLMQEGWPPGYSSSKLATFSHSVGSYAADKPQAHITTYSVLEDTLLSKAFADAIHPTRIIPFYFKASRNVHPDDVTITTLITLNRFRVFKQLVERYRGPISVTIHVPLPLHTPFSALAPNHPSRLALADLHALYASSPLFAQHVDIHLALSPFTNTRSPGPGFSSPSSAPRLGAADVVDPMDSERQFNLWRNAARLFARSDFIMLLDVDFAVCTDWRAVVRAAFSRQPRPLARRAAAEEFGAGTGPSGTGAQNATEAAIFARLREGSAALVVPAFEYVKQEHGVDQRAFPTDKQALLRLTQAQPPAIASFHASWAPGHNSTDYERWLGLPPGAHVLYEVERYQSAYEPYVITSKRVPWCDERFAGYGANKAACLFEMHLSGVSFFVLSDHFLVHQSHAYEEAARREEVSSAFVVLISKLTQDAVQRKANRKIYAEFKEEACLRYLYRYHRDGTLHTPRAANARTECRKIKKIAKTLIGDE